MKLDDAIAKVVKASEGLHVEKYTCVPEWQALLVATLGLLVAIAEWRKPPPGQGTAFDRLAAAMLDLRKRDEAIGEALRAWYGWLDAREAADAAPAPAEPLPVLAAAERLASGHVQRLTDGTWEWSPDGGFDRCVVPLGPEVSAFLSGIVKDAQETSARRPKSLREAFDSSSDEWDRLAAGRRRPADYAARRAQGETGHGMVRPVCGTYAPGATEPFDAGITWQPCATCGWAERAHPTDDAEAMMANVGARLRENAASRRARKP